MYNFYYCFSLIFIYFFNFKFLSAKDIVSYDDHMIETKTFDALSILSSKDQNSIFLNSFFFKNNVNVIYEKNNDELINLILKYIDSKRSFKFIKKICGIRTKIKSFIAITKFFKELFYSELFIEAKKILTDNNFKENLRNVITNLWFEEDYKAFHKQFCDGNKNWITSFKVFAVNNLSTTQIIQLKKHNRFIFFGTSPEFELIAYTMCVLFYHKALLADKVEIDNIHKCNFLMAPTNHSVVIAAQTTKDLYLRKKKMLTTWINKNTLTEKDKMLQQVVTQMWLSDVDRLKEDQIHLDWGNPVNHKTLSTNSKLITYLDESIFEKPIYKALIDIYNSSVFHPSVCMVEPELKNNRLKIVNTFLNLIFETDVFKQAYEYLKKLEKADKNFNDFTKKVFSMWLGFYSRCDDGTLGSSGFEHVFCGEYRENHILDGHHNWLHYYLDQEKNLIKYNGYYTYRKKILGTFKYSYNGYKKKKGGFFFRTSPAFDFSLFTICALTHHGNENCKFSIEKNKFYVTSFFENCDNGLCISTTYPGTNMSPDLNKKARSYSI